MKQENKELLLKDLCSRLPYGVEVEYDKCNCELLSINKDNEELTIRICPGYSPVVKLEEVKPYLFPLSSMTWEQECQYKEIIASTFNHYEVYDWLNKNNFDYRGLIPLGLANDATGLNIY